MGNAQPASSAQTAALPGRSRDAMAERWDSAALLDGDGRRETGVGLAIEGLAWAAGYRYRDGKSCGSNSSSAQPKPEYGAEFAKLRA